MRGEKYIQVVSLLLLAIGIALAWPAITAKNSAQRKQSVVSAQTSGNYTSTWTVDKWMGANMRYGANCGNCGERGRDGYGDVWTQNYQNLRFSFGPAAWKVQTDLGETRVCEKWRVTKFKVSSNSAAEYSFPNDDTERKAIDGRNDGTSVWITGNEGVNGGDAFDYIGDRWRIERTNTFEKRKNSGANFLGAPAAYGITLYESAGVFHASAAVDTDVDELLTVFPTVWTVSGRLGDQNLNCNS